MTCEQVKEFLSRRQVPFRARPIAEGDNLAHLAARNPTLRTAPVTYVGTREIVGWDVDALAAALADAGLGTTEVEAPAPYPAVGGAAAISMPERSLVVTSFLASTIVALSLDEPDGHVRSDRVRSLPGRPIAAALVAGADAVAVVACDAGVVTWLRAADATPLHGSLTASSVAVGTAPLDVVADPHATLAYVSASESRVLAVVDPTRRSDAGSAGTRITTNGQPGVLAFAARRDLLFVRQREGATLVFEGEALRRDAGRARPRVLATPPGRGLALSSDEHVLLVPSPLGERGELLHYDLDHALGATEAQAHRVTTGDMPFGIAAHPTAPLAYVSCFRPPRLELRDTSSGGLATTAEEAIISLPSPARAMVVDPATDTVYVSCYDTGTVLGLDARTGRPRASAPWEVPAGPRGMVLVDQTRLG